MGKQGLRLGICTGGGDCPGLNAAIRGVVKQATGSHGASVFGVRDGLTGLLAPRTVRRLQPSDVEGILTSGGTILGTNNQGSPFHDEASAAALVRQIKANFRRLKLDAMVVIGGDGTQFMAKQLSAAGMPLVGIPKTIDNDLRGTDQTIGFATAVDIASAAALRLGTSAEAHSRIMILEVMGRDGGHIALATALASAADAVLLPEIAFGWEALGSAIKARRRGSRRGYLIVAAEGATPQGGHVSQHQTASGATVLGGVGNAVAQMLTRQLGIDARAAVLGHIQRGGEPNAADRLLATRFAVRAVDLILAGDFGKIVGMRGGREVTIAYQALSAKRRLIDLADPWLATAEATGLCLGR